MIYVLKSLESTLLPSPDQLVWGGRAQPLGCTQKVQYYVGNLFKFAVSAIAVPFAAVYSGARSLFGRVTPPLKPVASQAPTPLPKHRGFADSLFQSSGLGTRSSATQLEGTCNWEKWLTPARIEGTDAATDYRAFFTDVLKNPEPFIKQLQAMGVTAYRFSLEWSVIKPNAGHQNADAIATYKAFIQKLKAADIEPYVTLHHFVHPQWFEDLGGFANPDNVGIFVTHATEMIREFPEVTYWMTFNEPGVFAFQGYVRGVFPPGISGNLALAGRVMRNLLNAHCQIYQQVKATDSKPQIGITHQWLKFEPLGNNLLEQAICYFLSKITHFAVYNFFKTGQFALQIPFKANVQFSIPNREFRANNQFIDFFGVQWYGYPRLKMGFNGGQAHPGYKVTNFTFGKTGLTFGSTCPSGGKMQSFGPSVYPESLEDCLNEAWALERPVAITETGCDARIQHWGEREFRIDDHSQAACFTRIFEILRRQPKLHAFFAWTFWRGHLEWDRGSFSQLGVANSPAATILQTHFQQSSDDVKSDG